MKSNIETQNESNPPPQPSFSSLPEDIVLCILARISTSYYPKLCLVSKSFCSLILSKELENVRWDPRTREDCVYVCFQSGTHPYDHLWFSLWIKPDDHQTLPHLYDRRWFGVWVKPNDHQTLTYCMLIEEDKCTSNLLVPMPSSCSPQLPKCYELVGSDLYEIGGQYVPSSNVLVKKRNGKWCKSPKMMVARKNAVTCTLDGKLYVMGGCEVDESTHWAEVFDPNTQTWEPLPDPGTEIRSSSIMRIEVILGDVYVKSNYNKDFIYLTKERRWEVVENALEESICKIENTMYCYTGQRCWWYDTKGEEWRLVKGLSELDRYFRFTHRRVEIGGCGEKLVIFWVGPVTSYLLEAPEIWCAVILLEKRNDGEVWGQIEWVDVVLRVPSSHTLLYCVEALQ